MQLLQRTFLHWIRRLWRAGAVLALAWVCTLVFAQQSVPVLTSRVMDTTGTLTSTELQRIEKRLAALEAGQGAQVVVLLVQSTQPEDIASYANRVSNDWKIGRREIGDGLLLLVALKDRKVRIEVAKTLEGAIPDLAAKRIIDTEISPRFKQADYAGGIEAGLAQIASRIAAEKLPPPTGANKPGANGPGTPGPDAADLNDWAVFLFFVLPMAGAIARRALGAIRGALATAGLTGVAAYWVTSSLLISLGAGVVALMVTLLWGSGAARHRGGAGHSSPGGWAGGGNQGGGFGSGGGGDFGGGGASGDW